MARFCRNCGKPVTQDEKFCHSCGYALQNVSQAKICKYCGNAVSVNAVFAAVVDVRLRRLLILSNQLLQNLRRTFYRSLSRLHLLRRMQE